MQSRGTQLTLLPILGLGSWAAYSDIRRLADSPIWDGRSGFWPVALGAAIGLAALGLAALVQLRFRHLGRRSPIRYLGPGYILLIIVAEGIAHPRPVSRPADSPFLVGWQTFALVLILGALGTLLLFGVRSFGGRAEDGQQRPLGGGSAFKFPSSNPRPIAGNRPDQPRTGRPSEAWKKSGPPQKP
jgi:hypothetical protein